jgi:hypothetical protein
MAFHQHIRAERNPLLEVNRGHINIYTILILILCLLRASDDVVAVHSPPVNRQFAENLMGWFVEYCILIQPIIVEEDCEDSLGGIDSDTINSPTLKQSADIIRIVVNQLDGLLTCFEVPRLGGGLGRNGNGGHLGMNRKETERKATEKQSATGKGTATPFNF